MKDKKYKYERICVTLGECHKNKMSRLQKLGETKTALIKRALDALEKATTK